MSGRSSRQRTRADRHLALNGFQKADRLTVVREGIHASDVGLNGFTWTVVISTPGNALTDAGGEVDSNVMLAFDPSIDVRGDGTDGGEVVVVDPGPLPTDGGPLTTGVALAVDPVTARS